MKKKLLILILALIMIFSLVAMVACDGDDDPEPVDLTPTDAVLSNAKITGSVVTWDCDKIGTKFDLKVFLSDVAVVSETQLLSKQYDLSTHNFGNGEYTVKVVETGKTNFITATGSYIIKMITGLAITGETVSWNYNEGVDCLVRFFSGNTELPGTSYVSNEGSYNFAGVVPDIAGTYVITVSDYTDASVASVSINYTIQPVVFNVTRLGATLYWDSNMTSGSSYTVYAYNLDKTEVATSSTTTNKSFVLTNLALYSGTYAVGVKPTAGGEVVFHSNQYEAPTISPPVLSNPLITDNIFTWDCVSEKGATFIIKAYNESNELVRTSQGDPFTETEYDLRALGLSAGTFTITVTVASTAVVATAPTTYVVAYKPPVEITRAWVTQGDHILHWLCEDSDQAFSIVLWNPCAANGSYNAFDTLEIDLAEFGAFHDDYHYHITVSVQGTTNADGVHTAYYFGLCGKDKSSESCEDCISVTTHR